MPISQRSEVNYLTNLNTLALNTVKLIADIVISKAVPERGGYKWAYEVKGVKIYSPVVGRGAAGIGLFLLNMYKITGNYTYLKYAEGAATWIISQAEHRDGGVTWRYYDLEGGWYLTPYKGVAGIARFLLELYLTTNNPIYLKYSEEAAKWIINVGLIGDKNKAYVEYNPYHQAAFGIYSHPQSDVGDLFLRLYSTTGKTEYLEWSKAIANWIISTAEKTGPPAPPQTEARELYKWYDDRGYQNIYWFSGTVVLADYLFKIYRKTGNTAYYRVARGFVDWMLAYSTEENSLLKIPAKPDSNTYPTIVQGIHDRTLSIRTFGEILLRAYEETKDTSYLDYARKYANWITSIATTEDNLMKIPLSNKNKKYSILINSIIFLYLAKLSNHYPNYTAYLPKILNWIKQQTPLENNISFPWGLSGTGYYLTEALKTLKTTNTTITLKSPLPVTIILKTHNYSIQLKITKTQTIEIPAYNKITLFNLNQSILLKNNTLLVHTGWLLENKHLETKTINIVVNTTPITITPTYTRKYLVKITTLSPLKINQTQVWLKENTKLTLHHLKDITLPNNTLLVHTGWIINSKKVDTEHTITVNTSLEIKATYTRKYLVKIIKPHSFSEKWITENTQYTLPKHEYWIGLIKYVLTQYIDQHGKTYKPGQTITVTKPLTLQTKYTPNYTPLIITVASTIGTTTILLTAIITHKRRTKEKIIKTREKQEYIKYLQKLEQIKDKLKPEIYQKLKKEYEEKIREYK